MAYARLDEKQWRRLHRYFCRNVDLTAFVLAWRDGWPVADIADHFDLKDVPYVSTLRRRLGLPSRGWGGPRVKNTGVTPEMLAHFASIRAAARPGRRRVGTDLGGASSPPVEPPNGATTAGSVPLALHARGQV